MNWGKGLALFILFFIAVMMTMVFIAFKQKNELIDSNYYQREQEYQSIIDANSNLKKEISGSIISQSENEIIVHLADSLSRREFSNGKIDFLKMDNQKLDRSFDFTPDENGSWKVSKQDFSIGLYKVKVSWKSTSTPYYYESDLLVSK